MFTKLVRQTLENRRETAARKRRASQAANLPRAALIFGGGAYPGIGAAVARRVAQENIKIYFTGRTLAKLEATVAAIREAGGAAQAVVVDVADEAQIAAAFAQAEADGFAIDLVVHNVGTNRPGKFMDIDPAGLEQSWRSDCRSGFFVGQHAVRHMLNNGRGTILFTGASASLRGKSGFGAFSSNKAGLRSLAQSLAREYGPHNIHVAHVVIDGMVDGERLKKFVPGLVESQGEDGALHPDAVAESYWQLYRQHPSTWTQELDLRPYRENW